MASSWGTTLSSPTRSHRIDRSYEGRSSVSQLRMAYVSIPSDFGEALLVWRDDPDVPRILRIILPAEEGAGQRVLRREFPQAVPRGQRDIAAVCARIGDLLKGKPVDFSTDLLDLRICNEFQRRVLLAEAQIPRGRVSTYGRLARRIGAPRAARAVGRALARNPFPLIIPCHRAIRADGSLGGFQGGAALKRALLELEGIVFNEKNRVLARFIW